MWHILKKLNFRYKGEEGFIQGFKKWTWVKEGMDWVEDVLFDYAPIFFDKKNAGIPFGPSALLGSSWNTAASISTSVIGQYNKAS